MKCIPDSVDTFQIAVSRGRVPNLPVVRALPLLGYPVRTFIEGQLPKLAAVGSSPVSRSMFTKLTLISRQDSAVARGKAGMTGREACPTGLSRVHTVIRVGRLVP